MKTVFLGCFHSSRESGIVVKDLVAVTGIDNDKGFQRAGGKDLVIEYRSCSGIKIKITVGLVIGVCFYGFASVIKSPWYIRHPVW